MGYDAVLFDHDGVLVEPTPRATLREATAAAFRACGVAEPDPAHVESMVTDVTIDGLESVCGTYGLEPETFWRARDEHASRAQREAVRAGEKPLYPDVDALADLPVPLGVVSSNQHATVEFVLESGGLTDRFGACYGREPAVESIRRKKPDPHYLERALADLGLDGRDGLDSRESGDPPTALYVGDRAHDVAAAHNAGIDGALLRRDHVTDGPIGPDPDHELESLEDLRPLVDGVSR